MELIYIITYKCNLNCSYCLVKKNNQSIEKKTLKESLKLYKNSQINSVKFFGGEPLLEFENIKYIIKQIRKIRADLLITLTTNGLLLDKQRIEFFKKYKVDLVLSLDGNEFTQLKNRQGQNSFRKIVELLNILPKETVFNIVIAPNTVKYLDYNFKYLLGLGIKNYNFLPAYYNDWQAKDIKMLAKNFDLLLDFIKNNNLKETLFLKNINNFSEISFFNQSLVIDCDGLVYNSNAILFEILAPNKDKFLIGDISRGDYLFNKVKKIKQADINQYINKKDIKINKQLDDILNMFVYKYKKLT